MADPVKEATDAVKGVASKIPYKAIFTAVAVGLPMFAGLSVAAQAAAQTAPFVGLTGEKELTGIFDAISMFPKLASGSPLYAKEELDPKFVFESDPGAVVDAAKVTWDNILKGLNSISGMASA